jgi:hypothetical protein
MSITSWCHTRVLVSRCHFALTTGSAYSRCRNIFSCSTCGLFTNFISRISDLISWTSRTNSFGWYLFIIRTCWSDTWVFVWWNSSEIGTSCTNSSCRNIFSAWTRSLIYTNFICGISDLICWAICTDSNSIDDLIIGTSWCYTGILIRWDSCKIVTSCANTQSWDVFSGSAYRLTTSFPSCITYLVGWTGNASRAIVFIVSTSISHTFHITGIWMCLICTYRACSSIGYDICGQVTGFSCTGNSIRSNRYCTSHTGYSICCLDLSCRIASFQIPSQKLICETALEQIIRDYS